jgi:hypothetical protein
MSGFEFDIELLIRISLAEARPVSWNKTDDIYRQKTKKAWREVFIYLQDDFEAL